MKINLSFWRGLSDRERVFLTGLAVFLAFSVVIFAIYMPLTKALDTKYQSLSSEYRLLDYLGQSSRFIRQYQSQQITIPKKLDKSLLVTAEKKIKDARLSSYLAKISQVKNKELLLSFKQVPFDKFIAWLSHLTHQYPVVVRRLSCQKTKDSGIVDVTVSLQRYV